MEKNAFLIILTIALSSHSFSQTFSKKVFHAGENISYTDYYLFPSFAEGRVNLKDGKSLPEQLNFNRAFSQIQFIGPKGDTLILSKPENVDSIYVGNSIFFYREKYFEIPSGTDSIRLAISRTASYESLKIGAFGIATHNGGIESFTSIVAQDGDKNLIVNEDFTITEKTSFFFLKPDGEMQPASKAELLKIFLNKKSDIEVYLKSNKTNFNKSSDLIRILHFCVHG